MLKLEKKLQKQIISQSYTTFGVDFFVSFAARNKRSALACLLPMMFISYLQKERPYFIEHRPREEFKKTHSPTFGVTFYYCICICFFFVPTGKEKKTIFSANKLWRAPPPPLRPEISRRATPVPNRDVVEGWWALSRPYFPSAAQTKCPNFKVCAFRMQFSTKIKNLTPKVGD